LNSVSQSTDFSGPDACLALGFINYAIIKACSGRGREMSWLTYTLAIVLVLYFVFARSRMG